MIDSQFKQQKAFASLFAPQSNVRFHKRQWRYYQLQYVGTDITMSVINVVEMLFSETLRCSAEQRERQTLFVVQTGNQPFRHAFQGDGVFSETIEEKMCIRDR